MKRRFWMSWFVGLLCLCVLLLTACRNAEEDQVAGNEEDEGTRLKLVADDVNVNDPQDYCWQVAFMIEEQTAGTVNVEVVPLSNIGTESEAYEALKKGEVDLLICDLLDSGNAAAGVKEIPFLFANFGDMMVQIGQGAPFFEFYRAIHGEHGIGLLAFFFDGFEGIAGNGLDAAAFDWNTPKPLRVAVLPLEVTEIMARDLGFEVGESPDEEEWHAALSSGNLDGCFGLSISDIAKSYGDAVDSYVDLQYKAVLRPCLVNEENLSSLPANYQESIWESFAICAEEIAVGNMTAMEEATSALAAAGTVVYTPSEEEMAAVSEHIRTQSWPQYEAIFGVDVMADLRASLGI